MYLRDPVFNYGVHRPALASTRCGAKTMREREELSIIKPLIDCLYTTTFYTSLIIHMVSCFLFVSVNLNERKRRAAKLV